MDLYDSKIRSLKSSQIKKKKIEPELLSINKAVEVKLFNTEKVKRWVPWTLSLA